MGVLLFGTGTRCRIAVAIPFDADAVALKEYRLTALLTAGRGKPDKDERKEGPLLSIGETNVVVLGFNSLDIE